MQPDCLRNVPRGDPHPYFSPAGDHVHGSLVEKGSKREGSKGKTNAGHNGHVHIGFIEVFDGPKVGAVDHGDRRKHDLKGVVVATPTAGRDVPTQGVPDLLDAAADGVEAAVLAFFSCGRGRGRGRREG